MTRSVSQDVSRCDADASKGRWDDATKAIYWKEVKWKDSSLFDESIRLQTSSSQELDE